MTLFEKNHVMQAGEVARALGVTRQTAHRYLRQLVLEGALVAEGAGRGSRYRMLTGADEYYRYATSGLEEDRVWVECSAPDSLLGRLPSRARDVFHYALTELVNNVIDHSGAAEVELELSQEDETVELVVRDLGIGIFVHIRDRLGLASELEALQELSKGKTTTMPERHTGEGIFFTSKAADRFEIESGRLRLVVDNLREDMAVGSLTAVKSGTVVRFVLDPSRARDLTEVFAQYTGDFEFSKTRVIIKLFAIGTRFVSRSEAKRLVHGLERFRQVIVDFDQVELVGQGFVDEVFRVWAHAHPNVTLNPINMNDAVTFMVERAVRSSDLKE